jgi:hypothetical protein
MWTVSLVVFTIPGSCESYEIAAFTGVEWLHRPEGAMDHPLVRLLNVFFTISSRTSRQETE